jgi:hypothetical protein
VLALFSPCRKIKSTCAHMRSALVLVDEIIEVPCTANIRCI